MKLSLIPKIVIPLVFLVVGIGAANYLIKTKPKAKNKASTEPVILVSVMDAVPSTQQVTVVGSGTVVPARLVVVQPEVSGRVTDMNPELVKGGRLKADTMLITIDASDYRLQVSQQSAQISGAKAQLRIEKGRQRLAQREWKILGKGKGATNEGKALALREPQIAAARAQVRSAQVAKRRAQLMEDKTVINVPFNATVDDENVEKEQIVSPGSRLATLIGTDEYWVEVALPIDKLRWLSIPGVSTTAAKGSTATVTLDMGRGTLLKRTGHIIRLKPSLDPKGRMARVVVSIDNPLGLREDGTTDGLPLLTGAFVQVELVGSPIPGVVKLPRLALREGKQIWLFNSKSRLEMKDVTVRWRLRDNVYVSGIESGSKVVTSAVAGPVPNLLLAIDEGTPPSKKAPKTSAKAASDSKNSPKDGAGNE